MIAFKMQDGDILFDNNEFQIAEGIEQLAQEVNFSTTTRRGGYFLDERAGMRHDSLNEKDFNEDELRYDIVESLDGTSQLVVVDGVEIKSDFHNRKSIAGLTLSTEDGEIIQLTDLEVEE